MSLTAKEAGIAVGITRQGIIKAIKEGRISGDKNVKGEWVVEPSELFRVYTQVKPDNGIHGNAGLSSYTHNSTPDLQAKNSELQTKLDVSEERIAELKTQLRKAEEREERLQQQVEKLTDMADRQTRLLEHQTEKPTEKPTQSKKTFWPW